MTTAIVNYYVVGFLVRQGPLRSSPYQKDSPEKTVSDPAHLRAFCPPPPYSISLCKSLRNAPPFSSAQCISCYKHDSCYEGSVGSDPHRRFNRHLLVAITTLNIGIANEARLANLFYRLLLSHLGTVRAKWLEQATQRIF